VAKASGEYIWIAESDDYADPDLLKTLVNCLEQHPGVGVAYSNSSIVDDKGALLETWDYWMQDIGGGKMEAQLYK
jgi:GT2 family glycosyltransferase